MPQSLDDLISDAAKRQKEDEGKTPDQLINEASERTKKENQEKVDKLIKRGPAKSRAEAIAEEPPKGVVWDPEAHEWVQEPTGGGFFGAMTRAGDATIPQVEDFFTQAASNLHDAYTSTWQMFHQPAYKTILDALKLQAAPAQQATAVRRSLQEPEVKGLPLSAKAGAYYEDAVRSYLSGVPLAGPMLNVAFTDMLEGKYGKAAADAAFGVFPEMRKLLAGKVGLPGRATPVERARIDEFERRSRQRGTNVRVLPGEKYGSPFFEKTQRLAEEQLGGGRLQDAYGNIQKELRGQAFESAAGISPTQPAMTGPEYEAGLNVYNAGKADIQNNQNLATSEYNYIRSKTSQFRKRLQNGWKNVPDPNHPLAPPIKKPKMEWFETPVDIRKMQKEPALRQAYDTLNTSNWFPKEYNPGFAALRKLMTEDDWYKNGMDFDKDLGAIKAMLRRSDVSNILTSQGQRLALQVVDAGETQLAQALNQAAPGLARNLRQARQYVQNYHRTDEVLDKVAPQANWRLNIIEPQLTYDIMLKGGDKNYDLLEKINQIAPAESKALARTWFEQILNKAYKNGKLQKTDAVVRAWDRLGDKTKQLWFGPQRTQEIDTVVRNMNRLEPAKGSPTATRSATKEQVYGIAGGLATAVGGVLAGGHPGVIAGGLGTFGLAAFGPAVIARILTMPTGPRWLAASLIGTGKFAEQAQRELTSLGRQAQVEEEQEKKRTEIRGPGKDEIYKSTPPAVPPAAGAPPSPPRQPGRAAGLGGPPRPQAAATPPAAAPAARPPATTPLGGPRTVAASAPSRQRTITPELGKQLDDTAQAQKIPASLMRGIATAEGLDPNGVSPKGAQGLMQLMPDTQTRFGVSDPFNVQQSMDGGARYLRYLMGKYNGDIRKVAAAYNAGEGAVDKYNGVPPYKETRAYVQRVLMTMGY
jgi:soluble lytic murein transglycosylase-like protein